jgi:tetratricopeptide (TPR) repeat protein
LILNEFSQVQFNLDIATAFYLKTQYSLGLLRDKPQETEREINLKYTDQSAQRRLAVAQTNYDRFQQELEVARGKYQTSLSVQPDNLDALIGLGLIADYTGSPENAIPFFQKAISAHPESHTGFVYLGNVYLELGRTEEALVVFLKALDKFPDSVGAAEGIILAYQVLGLESSYQSSRGLLASQRTWDKWVDQLRREEN